MTLKKEAGKSTGSGSAAAGKRPVQAMAESLKKAREKDIAAHRQKEIMAGYAVSLAALFIIPIILLIWYSAALSYFTGFVLELIALIYVAVKLNTIVARPGAPGSLTAPMPAKGKKQEVPASMVNYVKKELVAHYPEDSIKKAFYRQGYKKDYADAIVAEAKKGMKGGKLK